MRRRLLRSHVVLLTPTHNAHVTCGWGSRHATNTHKKDCGGSNSNAHHSTPRFTQLVPPSACCRRWLPHSVTHVTCPGFREARTSSMRCASLKCHKYVSWYGRLPGTLCSARVASQRSSDTGPSQSHSWNTPVTKGEPDSITKIGPRFVVQNPRVSMVFFKPDGKSKMSAVHAGLMMMADEPRHGR